VNNCGSVQASKYRDQSVTTIENTDSRRRITTPDYCKVSVHSAIAAERHHEDEVLVVAIHFIQCTAVLLLLANIQRASALVIQ
jgi:hypothetical protein